MDVRVKAKDFNPLIASLELSKLPILEFLD